MAEERILVYTHVDPRLHVVVVLGGGVLQQHDVDQECRASSIGDGEQRSLVRDSTHNNPG